MMRKQKTGLRSSLPETCSRLLLLDDAEKETKCRRVGKNSWRLSGSTSDPDRLQKQKPVGDHRLFYYPKIFFNSLWWFCITSIVADIWSFPSFIFALSIFLISIPLKLILIFKFNL